MGSEQFSCNTFVRGLRCYRKIALTPFLLLLIGSAFAAYDVNDVTIDASVTFYLKRDALEGFDVRFDREQLESMMKFLRERYGKPVAEGPDPVKLEWKEKDTHAVLTAEPKRRRASLLVSRGAFEEEIYKVR